MSEISPKPGSNRPPRQSRKGLTSTGVRKALAVARSEQQRFDDAIAAADEVLRIAPDDQQALNIKAIALRLTLRRVRATFFFATLRLRVTFLLAAMIATPRLYPAATLR